jgi:hypothetical protein
MVGHVEPTAEKTIARLASGSHFQSAHVETRWEIFLCASVPLRLNKSLRHCAPPLACETFSLAPIFGKLILHQKAMNPKRHSVSLSSRESQPHPLRAIIKRYNVLDFKPP